ncbi:MAG TPA: DMT family transporter [Pseudolabrys sp.]|nr:DMT family transporter [Pseudolabrys sp.]
MHDPTSPAAAKSSAVLIGAAFGIAASIGWAAGFVAAKHGVAVGFAPADLAFHRFFWTGLLLMPLAFKAGTVRLGGIGWGRSVVLTLLSGPTQSLLAYTGFTLVPLGHGTTIQPACAALFGLVLATLILGERPTAARIAGGVIIIVGLGVFGAESLATIGSHGVGGDLLFASAGLFWASFGTLLRLWQVPGTRAAAVVGALSVLIYAPLYLLWGGADNMLRMGLAENLLQIAVQGLFAGALPIYLFARSVVLLGAGRAATFPALVPGFGVIIGYLALGVVPSLAQLIGLAIVAVGFRFVVR